MSIPSLVEGTGNNEARRVPNETNRQPPVPNLPRVLRKFGFFFFSQPPLVFHQSVASSLERLCALFLCAVRRVIYYDTLSEITFIFESTAAMFFVTKGLCCESKFHSTVQTFHRVEFNQCDGGMLTKSSTASPGEPNQVSLVKCVLFFPAKQNVNKT